jgi:hypothetical protein
MPEHFTKATTEAKFWCAKCYKPTMHRVSDGRRGACLECLKRLEAIPKKEPPASQGSLF